MTYSEEKIDVRGDGRIVLYKRTHLKRPKWQARISVPNATGYKVVSTKTLDLDEAKFFAKKLYEELCVQVLAGGNLQTKTFKQVFEEWKSYAVSTLGTTSKGGSWDSTIARIEVYPLTYFGTKRIDLIREGDFLDYWSWRKTKFNQRPAGNDTLRRERTSFMPVFKYAFDKGYITRIPNMHAPKAKGGRRPTFTNAEWKQIRDSSKLWLDEGAALATWRDRFMAMHCFLVLAYTGLRIGELRKLRWCDLFSVSEKQEDGSTKKYLVGHATGKTGTRQFVFQPGAEVCPQLIYRQRLRELELANPELASMTPDPKEPIFCHPSGKPIKEFKRSFLSLLKFAGIPVEKDGQARSIYSLRHLYATQRLSKETSPFLLARQMGTSIEMLEKHYGQVVSSTVAAQITKAKPSDIVVKGDIKFPF